MHTSRGGGPPYNVDDMKKRNRPLSADAEEEQDAASDSAGQSGDTQGLSDIPEADSESVEELVEEGQAFEAGVVGGVENAPDADVKEVTTREVPEDDVPPEYLEQD